MRNEETNGLVGGRRDSRIRVKEYYGGMAFLGICFVVASSNSELVSFVFVQKTMLSQGSAPGSPHMFHTNNCLPKLT